MAIPAEDFASGHACRDQIALETAECNALIYGIVDHVTTALLALGGLSIRTSISHVGQVPRDLASRSMATALVALEEWRVALREGLASCGEDRLALEEPPGVRLMDHMVRLYAEARPRWPSTDGSADPT